MARKLLNLAALNFGTEHALAIALEVVQFSDRSCTMKSTSVNRLARFVPATPNFITGYPVFIPKNIVLAYSLRGISSFVAHFFAHYQSSGVWDTSSYSRSRRRNLCQAKVDGSLSSFL